MEQVLPLSEINYNHIIPQKSNKNTEKSIFLETRLKHLDQAQKKPYNNYILEKEADLATTGVPEWTYRQSLGDTIRGFSWTYFFDEVFRQPSPQVGRNSRGAYQKPGSAVWSAWAGSE
jgi:hypothetical protein